MCVVVCSHATTRSVVVWLPNHYMCCGCLCLQKHNMIVVVCSQNATSFKVGWLPNHNMHIRGCLASKPLQVGWWFGSQTTSCAVVVCSQTTTCCCSGLAPESPHLLLCFCSPKPPLCFFVGGLAPEPQLFRVVVWLQQHNYCARLVGCKTQVSVWWFGSKTPQLCV